MSDQENLNIPEPDPSWDYYVLWHSLHHIKAKIDAALKIIGNSEDARPEIGYLIRNLLEPASDKFTTIVEQLPEEDD